MGLLSRLYQYASLCYVGGGLKRSGHHNILEAAVYGKAITTGPYIHKFSESVALNLAGGSFIVTNGKELFDVSSQELKWENAGRIASGYVQSNLGATNKIINWIEQHAFLKK
jgi:3-deoxy-D-manno-octulosonic-acid transferase